jgi:hypothetical protein
MPLALDADFLEAALIRYQEKLNQIESRMADLRHNLHVGPTASSPTPATRVAKKRKLSLEGRAHVAAAQRARWAAKKAASAPAPPKLSAKKAPVKRAERKAPAKAAQKRAATKKAAAELQATPPPSTQIDAMQ